MGGTFMFGAGMKVVSSDFRHVVWEKHFLNRVVQKQVKYILQLLMLIHNNVLMAHMVFFKHVLVKLRTN